ncbi:hypothetical protein [Glutamicibacter sp. FBE19]|uniref:hypothetical protein n=1 Tax=Glutamicibacter sp. FBE19 TaxID=2761534 RepID=UPI0018969F04|nr:hypothetical protein [Glutamicibacter sp. FBE19]MBF6671159.1 hypothetical protein [Glutamicibacter sp. FBE19]
MSLFSRKKVAKVLDVTPARVSQMATTGDIIQAVEDEDGTDKGWPETYVEEISARRTGRRTSRSIYGYGTQASTPKREVDYVAERNGKQAFVQVFRTESGLIGLITILKDVVKEEPPYKHTVKWNPWLHLNSDDLVYYMSTAEHDHGISIYDIAWVQTNNEGATEIVVTTEKLPAQALPDHMRFAQEKPSVTVSRQKISWPTLHSKLGMKVPMLDVPTYDAVDAWYRAQKTTATLELDVDGNYNRAESATLLKGLKDREECSSALGHAADRLFEGTNWSASGSQAGNGFLPKDQEHLEFISITKTPGFSHLRPAEDLSDEEKVLSVQERQKMATALAGFLYKEYGPYGSTPTSSLAIALDYGINVLLHPSSKELDLEPDDSSAKYPVLYALRDFRLHDRRPHAEYFQQLSKAVSVSTPQEYELLSTLNKSELDEFNRAGQLNRLLKDVDGNFVLAQVKPDYNDAEYTKLTVSVPVAAYLEPSEKLEQLKNFDEIVVEPDTQEGPVFLKLGEKLHIMPFGSRAWSEGFTHGYGGTGPSNLISALVDFLEWAAGERITKAGRERVQYAVVGADQGGVLRITRNQVMRPGSFGTEAS